MINTIIGGLIALISGIAIGIMTPTINSNIKKRELVGQQILKLSSILYLIKNNLVNYLSSHIYIDIIGEDEAGKEEVQKLKKLNKQIIINLDTLNQIQQELILNFRNETSSIPLIYEKIDEIEHFIWRQKINFNNNKAIYDQESSDEYSCQLDKMIRDDFIPKIESLIELNRKILKLKSTKRQQKI